jgi:hypothetical protein
MADIGKLAKEFADTSKQYACGLYSTVPGALIPNVGEDILRAFWDNLCGSPSFPDSPALPPLPSAPARPFTGGQCCDVLYRIDMTFTIPGRTIPLVLRFKPGKILRIEQRQVSGSQNFYLIRERCSGVIEQDNVGSSGEETAKIVIASVSREDGQADNCGSPPITYPPSPPVPPSGSYTSDPVSITYNDGSKVNYILNFKPPAVPAARDRFPSLTVNVSNPSLNIPITFNFDGTVSFGVPAPLPPIALPPDVVNKVDDTNKVVNDLNTSLGFINKPPNYSTDPSVATENRGEGEEDSVDKDGILGLKITLSTFPGKAQLGNPNIYFAGWLSFKLQGGYVERRQINYEVSYFEAPKGCKGYSYTLTNGAIGSAVVYSIKTS